jgi:RHS repeat-associated protein
MINLLFTAIGAGTRWMDGWALRVAMREAGNLSYLLTDHLGSTSKVANFDGLSVHSQQLYKPWGEGRYTSGTLPTTYKYTGQREEGYINLYWYNSRWYDPALGRFVQPDSIIPSQTDPLSWDRYCYTLNNPVRYNDPSGHCPWCGSRCGSRCGCRLWSTSCQ